MAESSEQLEPGANGLRTDGEYHLENGVFVRGRPVVHENEHYYADGYGLLQDMQRRHFWHRGRHRFLAAAIERHLPSDARRGKRVVDLGAGCGGWATYLSEAALFSNSQLAVGDSSLVALDAAKSVVPGGVDCYQIDLLDLAFDRRWDVSFLLDVIEHVDDDVAALRNAHAALVPGGWLFVTVPALQTFWSWNDEVAKHKRRYDSAQLAKAAEQAGFETVDLSYFMFLLSPLLLASRKLNQPRLEGLSEKEQWALIEATHAVPAAPVNEALSAVFALETPLSRWLKFPWGTSLLGVFRRGH